MMLRLPGPGSTPTREACGPRVSGPRPGGSKLAFGGSRGENLRSVLLPVGRRLSIHEFLAPLGTGSGWVRVRVGGVLGAIWVAFAALTASCVGFHEAATRSFLQRTGRTGFELRVMCWNIGDSSIFAADPARRESLGRIVRAVHPDVICLQEVMEPGRADDLVRMMDEFLPLGSGRSWMVHQAADNAVISRYPLLLREGELVFRYPYPELGVPDFHYGHAFALVDVPDHLDGRDVLIVAMHNKSRAGEENIHRRQLQSDAIVRWIRNARANVSFPDGTPMIILGDMNVLESELDDPRHHFRTLLAGDIVDEEAYGPDIALDWDGTELVDVRPSHNGLGMEFYTWRMDELPYPPGVLDRVLYTDSVLSVNHGFVLNTTIMSPDALDEAGLKWNDVLWEGPGQFDHLPMVVDFAIHPSTDR